MRTSSILAAAVAAAVSAPVLAGEPATLSAAPGKSVCHVQKATLASGETELRLCVKQGTFAHDEYTLVAGDAQIVKAIDDETTKGVSGKFRDQPVSLRCEPQTRAPAKPNPAMVDLLMKKQGMSQADAEKAALAMESVEEGRLCVAREGERELLRVVVKFE
jgi:hypothetical protein